MGANEHGVAIGNEAVFTRIPYQKGDGLIGMDLLRLGLERGRSAYEALQVITGLLATYGQGGNCGFQHPMFYHNSFILVDPSDAWVLETADRQWAAKQVRGVYTISNGITFGDEWDLASPDLVSYAVERGWCKGRADFDFARCYSDSLYTRFSDCRHRCQRTSDRLSAQTGRITPAMVMQTLRDHGGSDPSWRPDRGLTGAQVCMHAGFGPIRSSQTTGSMVSHLHSERPTHFFTATAAPCTSIFKPAWLEAGVPLDEPIPQGSYDPQTLFWRHEDLHRAVLADYAVRIVAYQDERDALEARWTADALALSGAPCEERQAFSARCFAEADRVEADWLARVRSLSEKRTAAWHHRRAWQSFNRQARR
jgi:dipeptidase